jgi:hypothetical protein
VPGLFVVFNLLEALQRHADLVRSFQQAGPLKGIHLKTTGEAILCGCGAIYSFSPKNQAG